MSTKPSTKMREVGRAASDVRAGGPSASGRSGLEIFPNPLGRGVNRRGVAPAEEVEAAIERAMRNDRRRRQASVRAADERRRAAVETNHANRGESERLIRKRYAPA